ncbi:MAG: winged helix-turn-helix transcriptional regulator [Anaerolineaceae bacterium]|nr:winged helix-turn-helix transcriptional regulator [Anaerolineaceae bacterium]
MDKIDLRISQILGKDGRISNSEIARQLNVSEGTVRQRLRKLTESGRLRVRAMVNSEQMPNRYLAMIGLQIEGRQLEKCAEEIDKFPQVQRTLIVTGRYDLMVSLLLDSHAAMVDFVTHKLSMVRGILQSETFVCLKNSDPWFPADNLCRSNGETTGR